MEGKVGGSRLWQVGRKRRRVNIVLGVRGKRRVKIVDRRRVKLVAGVRVKQAGQHFGGWKVRKAGQDCCGWEGKAGGSTFRRVEG